MSQEVEIENCVMQLLTVANPNLIYFCRLWNLLYRAKMIWSS